MVGQKMNDDEKITQILQTVAEISNEIKHLNQRLTSKTEEINKLDSRVTKLEIALAVNDVKTENAGSETKKHTGWFERIGIGAIAMIVTFIAIKVGLK